MLMLHCLHMKKNSDAYLISMMLLFDRYSLLLLMMMIRPYLYHLFLLMDMLLSMHCLSLHTAVGEIIIQKMMMYHEKKSFSHLNYFPVYLNRVFRHRATLSLRILVHVGVLASIDVTLSLPVVVVSEISSDQMMLVLNVVVRDDDDGGNLIVVRLTYELCSVKIRDFHQPVRKISL